MSFGLFGYDDDDGDGGGLVTGWVRGARATSLNGVKVFNDLSGNISS